MKHTEMGWILGAAFLVATFAAQMTASTLVPDLGTPAAAPLASRPGVAPARVAVIDRSN